QGALECPRASIGLRDGSGGMRLVAWRGLSERCRRAVEENWDFGREHTRPLFFDNLCSNSNIAPAIAEAARAEGIGALAVVPLVARGRLIGAFGLYHESPHPFSKTEMGLTVTIARQ